MADGGARFRWYGHACIELTTAQGVVVLIDPWLGNPRSPIAADAIERVDVLLVTHGHDDHMGEAVSIARRLQPTWPAIHELSLWAIPQCGAAVDIIGMNKGGTVSAAGVRVTMVHAEHSAGGPFAGDAAVHQGEPVGVVIELEDGLRVYHSGDTDVFGDMALIRELHQPDIAFLSIGGHYTMDPRGAAKAIELLGVSRVVPIHWGTFDILAGTPDQLRQALTARGLTHVQVISPEPGQTVGL
jgi:L-ascorbate metabolism protein UlaG (beta-lactamase superfamily)